MEKSDGWRDSSGILAEDWEDEKEKKDEGVVEK